ncbi:polyprenyl synthetase family protein [Candidatus Woesearchaeota archaeon]|nr:polyprenyl synthetase family protein [Candidatus Woesearchaeota archaeon]
MDAESFISENRKRIDHRLSAFFDAERAAFAATSGFSAEILDEIRAFVLRDGKRIRPLLCLLGYHGYAERLEHEDGVLDTACALELLHDFFLVHDDIIDRSDLRRNLPTLHKTLERKFLKYSDDPALGENLAIIAGDILLSLGFTLLAGAGLTPGTRTLLMKRYVHTINQTGLGEIKDIYYSFLDVDEVKEDDVALVNRIKTAVYTIETPLLMGAMAAGAPEEELARISAMAIPLGEAFQMKDDIIGMFGTAEEVGKPTTSDLEEGKKTLLILDTLRRVDGPDHDFIRSRLGRKHIPVEDFEMVKEKMRACGALDYAESMAREKTLAAKRELERLHIKPTFKAVLSGLADLLLERKK